MKILGASHLEITERSVYLSDILLAFILELHFVRTVPPNINRYPMGKVANVQANLGTAELNKIKHVLGSPIFLIQDCSWTLICYHALSPSYSRLERGL